MTNYQSLGFDELYEIVPGRIYQVYASGSVFRMYVCETMESGHTIQWQNRYDELLEIGRERVWRNV